MIPQAPRDQNYIPTLMAVSDIDGVTPVLLYADPVTHRLLVDLPSGSGTVTSISVVTANGFAGSVANATTTPAITITTTITGLLKGNGTAISAATAGTDYTTPTGTENLQNKTLDNTNTITLKQSKFTLQDATDTTKQLTFILSGIATANTRTITVPDASGTVTLLGNASVGSGSVVLATGPTISGASLTSSPTANTQSAGDNSTKVATTSFVTTAVNNAIAGVNPAVAVQAASATVLPNSPTYNNGVAGVGAFLTTVTLNTSLVVDGYTPVLNDRILVKNQASTFQNGVYFVSQVSGVGLAWILTRALDYNQPADMNNTGAIPVTTGTVNVATSWVQTSQVVNVGTDAVTFTQFSLNPTTLVVGPASATNLVPALFDGTSGKLIKNSTPTGTGNPVMDTSPVLATPAIASLKGTLTTDTDASTITFDKNVSDFHNVVLTANRILALSNMAAGDRIVLRLTQDGSGSHTVTWFTTIKWAGGSAPTLTTTINKADMFGLLCTSTGNYDGFVIGQNI